MRRYIQFSLVAVCFSLAGALVAQPPKFTLEDLGSLPQLDTCTATALSQSGNVVGYCTGLPNTSLVGTNGSPNTHAFLFTNGVIQDLNLSAFSTPLPTAVNDSAIVTGAYVNIGVNTGASAQAFVVQSDGTSQLLQGTLQGLLPFGLTNAGQIAGTQFQILSGGFNYFLLSQALLTTAAGAKPITLVPPPGTPGKGAAFGMSQANGWVAGTAIGPSATSVQATVWQQANDGTITARLLQQLSQYAQSVATAVNDSGMATGVAFDMNLNTIAAGPVPGSDAHAVMYSAAGAITDLGTLEGDKSSMGLGINNSGWVVGVSDNQAPPFGLNLEPILNSVKPGFRAFLYANGQMYDLSQLVNNLDGWQLTYAVQVNNAGQIIGTGLLPTGEQHAYLLTPVSNTPPPGPQITGVAGAGQSVPAVETLSTNSIFSMYGTAFAAQGVSHIVTSADLVNGTSLPTNVANTCVEGGGTRWPLLYVSATQINAVAGDLSAFAGSTVPVSVISGCDTANSVTSPAMNVTVGASAPEFLYFVANASGADPVAAVFAKGANAGGKVGAPNTIAGKTFTEAHYGDKLIAFGVGWGATSSTEPVGTLATGAASLPAGTYSLTVGGQPATVSYAGLAPTFAGLYQINFIVPTNSVAAGQLSGNAAMILTINGVQTPNNGDNTPYIAVTTQ